MTYCCPNCGYPSENPDSHCSMSCCYCTDRFVPQDERQLAKDRARAIENPIEDDADFVLPQTYVHGDKLHPFFDYACGERITSKSQRRRIYKQKGLRLKSVAEHKRQYPDEFTVNTHQKKGVSYRGQKHHKSAAEREGVRTGKGQLVL